MEAQTPNYMILHGFEGRPDGNWIPWLKHELEAKGGIVIAPALPNPDSPNVEEQIKFIVDNAQFNQNTILVGHSLGSVVAMKALERKGVKIKKLVLIMGYLIDNPEETYLDTFNWEFDIDKIKSLAEEIIVINDKHDTNIPKEK